MEIEYQWHKCVPRTGQEWIHTYDNLKIEETVMIHDYESILEGIDVWGCPLWLDISDWATGDVVRIAGNDYTISIVNGRWRARRDLAIDGYENLYYHKELGILVRNYTDTIDLEWGGGWSGYSIDVTIEDDNINEFISRITGNYLFPTL
ncbi:MAG: hypothetical protein ACFFE1_13875, partial [Candidatus Thorarchaeota archaeon]